MSNKGVVAENASRESVEFVRPERIAEKVVFVNGFTGTGKTMMAPIIGSLERVELMRFNYYLENAVQLHYMGAMREDVAINLIQMWTDLDLYRSMMGRETNFRYGDLSGAIKNARTLEYIRRLFSAGDAKVPQRVKDTDPLLLLITHTLIMGLPLIHAALRERLCFIELVRHPLYLIKQIRIYMPMFSGDPRIFQMSLKHGEEVLPWWTYEWKDAYVGANAMDRAIYMLAWYFRKLDEALSQLTSEARSRLLIVPFEKFVIDPWPFMHRFESLMNTSAGKAAKKMLKKQNVPRAMYAEGVDLAIYRRFGWSEPEPGATETEEFARRREYAATEASVEALAVLDQICAQYEANYMV